MDENIRKEFIKWGEQQLNSQSRLFQPKVVRNYMSALNTVFADDKLGLLAELNYMTSVFECLDLTQYKMIFNVITRHPKYNKVNADSNNNLSSALALYLRFLEYKNDNTKEVLTRDDYEKLIESEQKRVSSLSNAELKLKANFASQKRKKYYQIVSKERIRSPYVVQYVLNRADGLCDLCQQKAPFLKKDGTPYLEVHHVKWLSRGGADSIYNALALCPNCHRMVHNLRSSTLDKQLKAKLKFYEYETEDN